MTDNKEGIVLVTGASGFIGSHIVKQLQEGGYRVRGTVRSLENETKVKPLRELCPEAEHKLELVEADLTNAESWEAAMKDCTYVIHVASPYPLPDQPEGEEEVIKPAVEGTNNVLKACQAAKIKRVVLTSGTSAISVGHTDVAADKVFNEEDWSNSEKVEGYNKSKTDAEKAAWDFVKELPDEDKFDLSVINPGYVMGPVLCGSPCTSMEIPRRLLERCMAAIPKINFAVVDVRDVAAAHVKAMTLDEAKDKRHVLVSNNIFLREMAQIVAKEFRPRGYSVPTMHCPKALVWMKSLIDKSQKPVLPNIGKITKYDNTRMKEVLGIEGMDIKDTILDMCYSMIENGFVKKSAKYRGPGPEPAENGDATAAAEGEEEKKEEEKPTENGEVAADKPAAEETAAGEDAPAAEKKETTEKEEKKEEEKTEEKAEEAAAKPEEDSKPAEPEAAATPSPAAAAETTEEKKEEEKKEEPAAEGN